MQRLSLIIALLFVFVLPCSAQTRHSQEGEIEFEREEKKGVSYSVLQASVISHFDKLLDTAQNLSTKSFSASSDFSKGQKHYLAAVYLNCTLQKGACPEVLEGLLESEIINSKLSGKAQCPNMLGLWKSWIDADMERRVEFNLKVAHVNKAEKFKQQRGRYIKCQKTIQGVLKHSSSSENFLKKRYVTGSAALENIETLVNYLHYVRDSIPNVFKKTKTTLR